MKRKLIAVIMSALCFAAAVPSTVVLADGQKVVTLGADLSEEQKQAILRYFGVAGQSIETLTITNQDERNHLGSYVPLEQIGTRTYSCALVSPTSSGGIQVKTANLSWVTSNMIATTLSTSGVVNCDVLAAAPFEVSGTGALTGILMAYESAVGETLDETKKEVATQELITTTTIANNIGQVQATEIVNESKIQVIQGDVISDNDIDIIINEVADEENISLSDEDRELLAELLRQIAEQDYNYEEMKSTLERVEANMEELANQQEQPDETPETAAPSDDITFGENETDSEEQTETPETLASDSILMNTDDSALGESVVFDATDTSALSETEAQVQTEAPVQTEATDGFEIVSSDSYSDDPSADVTLETEAPVSNEEAVDGGGDITVLPEDGGTDAYVEPNEDGTDAPAAEESVTPIAVSDMVFAPATGEKNGYAAYPAGQNELTISFRRADVVTGNDGVLTVINSADGSVAESISWMDSNKVSIVPLTDEELLTLGWESGCKAVITLGNPLAQSASYYVTLSEGAFVSADGTARSEAVTDGASWSIQTSEFGFFVDRTNGIYAGSTVSGQIMMDGTAATYACIENADPAMVAFDQGEFSASGSFQATFYASGKTSFQVAFYDEAGNLLNTIDYTVEVK